MSKRKDTNNGIFGNGNIPILMVQAVTEDLANNRVVFSFSDTTYGIRAPFDGIFLLVVEVPLSNTTNKLHVLVDDIYGEARQVYGHKMTNGSYVPITAASWPGPGRYLMQYDTDTKKLHMLNE